MGRPVLCGIVVVPAGRWAGTCRHGSQH